MAGIVQPGFICVVEKNEFMKSFPGGWREVGGKLSNVDDEFTVLVQDKDVEGRDTYFEVSITSCTMKRLTGTQKIQNLQNCLTDAINIRFCYTTYILLFC